MPRAENPKPLEPTIPLASHGALAVACDPSTGAITSLTWNRLPCLATGGCAGWELDIGGLTMGPRRLAAWHTHITPSASTLTLVSDLGATAQTHAYQLEEDIVLSGPPWRVERRLRLACVRCPGPHRLLSATLFLDGLVAGGSSENTVHVPTARMIPGRSLAEVISDQDPASLLPIVITAQDCAPGVVAVCGPGLGVAIVPLPRQCPVRLSLVPTAGRLRVSHGFGCESHLDAGSRLAVAGSVMVIEEGDWPSLLAAVGAHAGARGFVPPRASPAWSALCTIHETDLAFEGGLKAFTRRLDDLQCLGFDTIYLMPWHLGGYGTIDYHMVDPALGDVRALRALCDAAHQRGMHVLFDLLVNIAHETSSYHRDHPDWFYAGDDGAPLRHPMWGGHCFDPASPSLRAFLVAYAERCVGELGADGFRVDAVAYRGGSWNNLPGLAPHQHSHAIFTLMAEIRLAIRAVNPEAILMAECFGPQQVPLSDLVCTSWIGWLDWALAGALEGRLGGAAVRNLFAEHMLCMPPGTRFTSYTHTHDTVAFEQRDLQGPAVDGLGSFWSLLTAGVMVFGGGWKMRRRPSPGEEAAYTALFAARRMLGPVDSTTLGYPVIEDGALAVVERPSLSGPVRVVLNLSPHTRPLGAARRRYSRLGSPSGSILAYDTVVEQAD